MNEFTMATPPQKKDMPDIAQTDHASHANTLDWVGMSQISLPLRVPLDLGGENPEVQNVNALASCFVNLNDPQAKGIHMSRLYLLLTDFTAHSIFSPQALSHFSHNLLQSHKDISDKVHIRLDFPLLLQRNALISQYAGWKTYPCSVDLRLVDQKPRILASVQLAYSSTCPCSAALARQMLQEAFSRDFKEQTTVDRTEVERWLTSPQGSYATPHSQRSEAYAQVLLTDDDHIFRFVDLINSIEQCLGTPVQTAVKRADEQEFAKLNGQNLMFCEDAARRIHHCLQQKKFADFRLKVSHFESLHAHDAVSMSSKGIPNGLSW